MHRFSRRWLLVGAAAAGLVGLGASDALPVAAADEDPAELRRRILAGAAQPYVGLAESSGRLALPDLPNLESVTSLLASTTRIRAFYAGPDRWRFDELTPVGERDAYRLGSREFVWDFGFEQLTEVVGLRAGGEEPLRLPRAGDLLPPELGRRLLALAPDDPVAALPGRRIAGHAAAGLRVTPADPETTVGRVDVWAEPETGLPLRVELAARADPAVPLLLTQMQDVRLTAPDESALTPSVPPGAGRVRASAADVSGALRVLDAAPPPRRLAGRDRVPLAGTADPELPGVGLYGSGLAGFALVPVSRGIVERAIDGASTAGGVPVEVPSGRAVRLTTPLVSVVVRGGRGGGVLLIGTVAPEVLERAVVELPGRRRP